MSSRHFQSGKWELAANQLPVRDSVRLSLREIHPSHCLFYCYFNPPEDPESKSFLYAEIARIRDQYFSHPQRQARRLERLFSKDIAYKSKIEEAFRKAHLRTVVNIRDDAATGRYFGSYFSFILISPEIEQQLTSGTWKHPDLE
jgi:hypothetical protein